MPKRDKPGHHEAGTHPVQKKRDGDLSDGKGIEECGTEGAKPLGIQGKVQEEVVCDDGVGGPIELGEKKIG